MCWNSFLVAKHLKKRKGLNMTDFDQRNKKRIPFSIVYQKIKSGIEKKVIPPNHERLRDNSKIKV